MVKAHDSGCNPNSDSIDADFIPVIQFLTIMFIKLEERGEVMLYIPLPVALRRRCKFSGMGVNVTAEIAIHSQTYQ